MTAVNKDPFVRTKNKDGLPDVFKGLVQAGSSETIKVGEICCFNKTAGYWEPVALEADFIYALAIAKEEQKAADGSRYMDFYSLHPDDEFEFAIAAARSLALGDRFVLTAADSQKLTYSAVKCPVARNVDYGHYPQEEDTTIRNRSYAVVSFMPNVSAWGLLINGCGLGQKKVVEATSALTLYPEMDGLQINNTGAEAATIHVLPTAGSAHAGCRFTAYCTVAQDNGFEFGTGSAGYVENAKQTDDKNISVDALGDCLEVVADPNHDWTCIATISSNADQTGAIDVEGS